MGAGMSQPDAERIYQECLEQISTSDVYERLESENMEPTDSNYDATLAQIATEMADAILDE
jgi:hypothetical protein